MFYVYILYSEKIAKHYIGQTQNIENRIMEHNSGESKFTKTGKPWLLVWSKALTTRAEAMALEKKIKMYGAKRYLLEKI